MTAKDFLLAARIRGRAKIWWSNDGDIRETANLVLYDWAPIVAGALSRGRHENHLLNYMYLEFQNGGNDVDPTPLVTRDAPYDYYNNLNSLNPQRDFLRVAVVTEGFQVSDAAKYSAENVLILQSRASAQTGIHGLPFNYASQSKVYGGAVVCARAPANRSADLVLARFYFPPGQQLLIRQSGHLVCSYDLEIL